MVGMGYFRAALRAATLLAAASLPAFAGSASAPFHVRVELTTESKSIAQCDRNPLAGEAGKDVSIVCTGGVPGPVPFARTDPRFLLHLYRDGSQVASVDGLVPPGTVTSWRVVNFADRDYLEIVVGW